MELLSPTHIAVRQYPTTTGEQNLQHTTHNKLKPRITTLKHAHINKHTHVSASYLSFRFQTCPDLSWFMATLASSEDRKANKGDEQQI